MNSSQPRSHPLLIILLFIAGITVSRVLSNAADLQSQDQSQPKRQTTQEFLREALNEEQKKLSDIGAQLNRMEDEQYRRQFAINDAQRKLNQAGSDVQALQQQEAAEQAQIYRSFTTLGSQEAQREAVASADLETIQSQMNQSNSRLQSLGQKVQELKASNMETDALHSAQAEYQLELSHNQQLQNSYRNLKAQAGEAAFLREKQENWLQQERETEVQSFFKAQLDQARLAYSSALRDYNQLLAEDSKQVSQINEVAADYDRLRNDYTALESDYEQALRYSPGPVVTPRG